MRSRWTDFPTTDGEKPTGIGDTEFETAAENAGGVDWPLWKRTGSSSLTRWAPLTEADREPQGAIRGEAHSVLQAHNRSDGTLRVSTSDRLFIFVACRPDRNWKTLSVPRRNQAEIFNAKVAAGEASQR